MFPTYVALLFGLPVILLIGGAVRDVDALGLRQGAQLLERLTVVGPALMLSGMALGLRVASWRGVILVARSDIDWILIAPVPRISVIRPRLLRMLGNLIIAGGLIGFTAAGWLGILIGVSGQGLAVVVTTGFLGGAATATLLGAAGWIVQCRPTWARYVLRVTPAVAVLGAAVAGFAWYGPVPPAAAGAVAAWSGPWGWALAGVMAIARQDLLSRASLQGGSLLQILAPPNWWTALTPGFILVALATITVAAAWRQMRAIPLEELRRREATSTRLLASIIYAADLRGGSQARREAITELAGRRPTSRRGPLLASLTGPWSSALLLLRSRERIGHAVVWVGAATAVPLILAERVGPAVVLMIAAVAYLAASSLIEPLRIELEQRFLTRSSLWATGEILRRQATVPAALLTLLVLLAVVSVTIAGSLSMGDAVTLLFIAPAIGALLTACAVVVATGPDTDPSWLYMGEIGVFLLVGHLTQGLQLATAIVGIPGALIVRAFADGMDPLAAVLVALAWAATATAALDRWSLRRLARYD